MRCCHGCLDSVFYEMKDGVIHAKVEKGWDGPSLPHPYLYMRLQGDFFYVGPAMSQARRAKVPDNQ